MDVNAPLLAAQVLERFESGTRYFGLRIERGEAHDTRATVQKYRQPGQYVFVAKSEQGPPSGFAIARAPDPGRHYIELLIAKGTELGTHLASLSVGDSVFMSEPQGQGYPLAQVKGRDLLLLSAGSGLAPIRALLEVVVSRRQRFGRVHLVHGQASRAELPFRDWLDGLPASDVSVELALSRAGDEWGGFRGYAQDLAETAQRFADVERLSVFVCGMPAMQDAAIELAKRSGVAGEQIFINQ